MKRPSFRGLQIASLLAIVSFSVLTCAWPTKPHRTFIDGSSPPYFNMQIFGGPGISDISDPDDPNGKPRLVIYFNSIMDPKSFSPLHDLAFEIQGATIVQNATSSWEWQKVGEPETVPVNDLVRNFSWATGCPYSGDDVKRYCFTMNGETVTPCAGTTPADCKHFYRGLWCVAHWPQNEREEYIPNPCDSNTSELIYSFAWDKTGAGADLRYNKLTVFLKHATLINRTRPYFLTATLRHGDSIGPPCPQIGVHADRNALPEPPYPCQEAPERISAIIQNHDLNLAQLPYLNLVRPADRTGGVYSHDLYPPFPPHEEMSVSFSESPYFVFPFISDTKGVLNAQADCSFLYRNQDGETTFRFGNDTTLKVWRDCGLPLNTSFELLIYTETSSSFWSKVKVGSPFIPYNMFGLEFPLTQDWKGTRIWRGGIETDEESPLGSKVWQTKATKPYAFTHPEVVTSTFKTAPIRINATYPNDEPWPTLVINGCVTGDVQIDQSSAGSINQIQGSLYSSNFKELTVIGGTTPISAGDTIGQFHFSSRGLISPTETYYLRVNAKYGNTINRGFDQMRVRFNPNADTDADGLLDLAEINTHHTKPCDYDSDGDGLSDGDEVNIYFTNPLFHDTDFDGMWDGWEVIYGLDPNNPDANLDPDGDLLSNFEEFRLGTDPHDPDTDHDGLDDFNDPQPLRGQVESASVSFGVATSNNLGLVGDLFRASAQDPNSAPVPFIVTCIGKNNTRPINAQVLLWLDEPTNRAPTPGQAAGFCPGATLCEPQNPLELFTNANGQAVAYLQFGQKTWGGHDGDSVIDFPARHYSELRQRIRPNALINPSDQVLTLDPADFSPHALLHARPDALDGITVEQTGFGLFADGSNVMFLQAAATTAIRAIDRFGNPIPNVKVKYLVEEGGGKLINHGPRFCRDNAGSPSARVCKFNSGAVQTTEIPVTLDVKGHYGEDVCAQCVLGTGGIFCPVNLNPDDQCDEVWWWTDSFGRGTVDWIMGSGPWQPGPEVPPTRAFQSLTVSLPDYPDLPEPEITLSGDAIDIPAHETLPWLLRLSSGAYSTLNASTQPAGATLPKPFRVAVVYRHDPSLRPDANPLVIVDDNLDPRDLPGGTVDVIFDVNSGVVSGKLYREEDDLEHAIVPLADAKPANPFDCAAAWWHLSCEERPSHMFIRGRFTQGDFVNVSDYYTPIRLEVTPNPDHCVSEDGIRMTLEDGTETDAIPMSPNVFYLEATPALEAGAAISDEQIEMTLTAYDAAMDVVDHKIVVLDKVGLGKYQSGPLVGVDHGNPADPCRGGVCGEDLEVDSGPVVATAPGGAKRVGRLSVSYRGQNYSGYARRDEIVITAGDSDEAHQSMVWVEVKAPVGYFGATAPIEFITHPPNDQGAQERRTPMVLTEKTSDAFFDYYRGAFSADAIRGFNDASDDTGGAKELAITDTGSLVDSKMLTDSLRGVRERGIGNKQEFDIIDWVVGKITGKASALRPKFSESFLKMAGVIGVRVEVAGRPSAHDEILASQQADILYFSGHGWHKTGKLIGTGGDIDPTILKPGGAAAFWTRDLEVVIFSACSVLDIKNYLAWTLYKHEPEEYDHLTSLSEGGGLTSPGDKWKDTGPTYFLGYGWKSPTDDDDWFPSDQSANAVAKALANEINRQLKDGAFDPIAAWRDATNPDTHDWKGRTDNAVAIKKVKRGPYGIEWEYSFWDRCSNEENVREWTTIRTDENGDWINKDATFKPNCGGDDEPTWEWGP